MFRGTLPGRIIGWHRYRRRRFPLNRALRWLLAIWTIVYLVVACGPLLLTDSGLLQGIGLLTGLILLVPWLVGVVVLAVLVWLTNPPPREP